ncbi:MAG: hypothetical protein ACYS32_04420 [Planctomycetota bacterium]
MKPRQKYRTGRKVLLALLIASIVCMSGYYFFIRMFDFGPRNILIRNQASEILSIKLAFAFSNEQKYTDPLPIEVKPNSSYKFRHEYSNSYIRVSYVLMSDEYVHEEFIPLWAGETVIFDIHPDGKIRCGYYYEDTNEIIDI